MNHELSERLAQAIAKINAKKPAAEGEAEIGLRCRNTHLAFVAMSHLVGDGLYVEGWVVVPDTGLVFEHAWIEQDNEIVDPTLWEEDLTYFPGLRFTAADVYQTRIETAGAEEDEFPLARRIGGWSGMEDPEYSRAYEEALALAQSIDGGSQNEPAGDVGPEK